VKITELVYFGVCYDPPLVRRGLLDIRKLQYSSIANIQFNLYGFY